MRKQNAAEKIREYLGCYNIMMHRMPTPKKLKTVSYGEQIRLALAAKNATPAKLATHKAHLAHIAARKVRHAAS